MADQRVMVSGAGLAGLVAAQALRHAGLQTRVFEQVPEMGPVGAIIGLTHRAASALEGMGRADLVESACIPVQGIEYFNWKGNALTRMPIAEVAKQENTRTFVAMRADIQLGLYDQLKDVVQTGSEVTGFEDGADGVTVKLADGREERGGAPLGAGGSLSPVRAGLRGDEPRYTGYMAWRGVATLDPVPLPPGEANQCLGRGRTAGAFGLSGGRMYWFVTSLMPPHGEDSPAGRKADALERFSGGPDFIRKAIDATPEEAILRNDVFDRPAVDSWGKGRVTILGDSAHATSPATGEGGTHAALDAAGAGGRVGAGVGRRGMVERGRGGLEEDHRQGLRDLQVGPQLLPELVVRVRAHECGNALDQGREAGDGHGRKRTLLERVPVGEQALHPDVQLEEAL